MFQEVTPIERYKIGSSEVYVKREDLFGQPPAPPLAKLRGARILLRKLRNIGIQKIGVYDTRISKAGQGIACVCKELDMECLAGFPQIKGTELTETHIIAEQQGAKLYPLTAGRTNICYHRFGNMVAEQGGYMLPLGLVCQETVEAVSAISNQLTQDFKTIVTVTGTGTICTGIAKGAQLSQVFGVSCGMSTKLTWYRILQLEPNHLFFNLRLIEPEHSYYDALDTNSCPFPTSPYYDMKAWTWLVKHIDELQKPVLFWNIGV